MRRAQRPNPVLSAYPLLSDLRRYVRASECPSPICAVSRSARRASRVAGYRLEAVLGRVVGRSRGARVRELRIARRL